MTAGAAAQRQIDKQAILLVCHANICRSPLAEGILRQLLQERGFGKKIKIDSAGTHAGFLSYRPDARAQRIALANGFDISKLKSRRIRTKDFERFTYIIAMDEANLQNLEQLCPEDHRHKLSLVLQYGDSTLLEVPDPYYGNEEGFARVYGLLHEALQGLVAKITQ